MIDREFPLWFEEKMKKSLLCQPGNSLSFVSCRILIPKAKAKEKKISFPFHAQDRLEKCDTSTMWLVMICFTDRANWLLTMADCN